MRRPGRTTIWPTRRDMRGCYVRIDPDDDDQVQLAFPLPGSDDDDTYGALSLDRREARMLARRINECLDATVRR